MQFFLAEPCVSRRAKVEDLEKVMGKKAYFENLVVSCDPKNFPEIKSLISQRVFERRWIQTLIKELSYVKIFDFKFLADILILTGRILILFSPDSDFSLYLIKRGIIRYRHLESPYINAIYRDIDEYEHPIKENTAWWYIYHDDIRGFVKHIAINEFDIRNQTININGTQFTALNFACFCASLNIIKYLFINKVQVLNDTLGWVVASGNEEAIDFFERKGYDYNNMLNTAIEYHQNKIAKWLYGNYNNDNFDLANCIEFFNTEMFLYIQNIMDKKKYQNEKKNCGCYFLALGNRDLQFATYLIKKGFTKRFPGFHQQYSFPLFVGLLFVFLQFLKLLQESIKD